MDGQSLSNPRSQKTTARDEMRREMEVMWARTMPVRGYDVPVTRLGIYCGATLFGAVAYTLARVMLLVSEDSALMAGIAVAIIFVSAAFPFICRAVLRQADVSSITEGVELAVMMFIFVATGLPLIVVMVPVVVLSIAAAVKEQIAGMWSFLFLLWITGEPLTRHPRPTPPTFGLAQTVALPCCSVGIHQIYAKESNAAPAS
eukprot:COSAG02_NODE_325_length_24616_cov_17.214667_12_plen_202_part_00